MYYNVHYMSVLQPPTNRVQRQVPKPPVNRGDAPPAARAYSVYTDTMQLAEREREIVQLVGRFKQLTTKQIKALAFPDQPYNPQARYLRRLLENKMLALVTEPLRGGVRGGSAQYVYQLGKRGREMYGWGRRGHSIVINHHQLRVVEAYIALFEADRRGDIRLLHWSTEPDCHISFGGITLKPDMYVDIAYQQNGNWLRNTFWLEIDLGTEHKRQILEKISTYKLAYEVSGDYPLDKYPTTVWLATRDDRASELIYWLKYVRDLPDIFRVGTVDRLLHILRQ